jgi:hypothetical protein
MVPIVSRNPNGDTCQGVLGKIHRGERFSSSELCRVIGRRKKSDVGPPRMAGAPGRWRAGILATRS